MGYNIAFICRWDKEKKSTWSGTCWSLMNSLKEYCSLTEMDISSPLKANVNSYYERIKRKLCEKSVLFYDIQQKLENLRLRKYKVTNDTIFFLFERIDFSASNKACLYIDMTMSELMDIRKKDSKMFCHSGFHNLSDKVFMQRLHDDIEFHKKCDYIFTMGEWLKNSIIVKEQIDEKKVFAVGGGINVNPNLIDYSMKKGNKFLFIGRDYERKGLFSIIKAFKIIYKYDSKYELYILGPNKDLPLDSIPGIHFIGPVASDEISFYYNLCDIFCMPSYFESYGLVFAEALVYGLPCIGRNLFSMAEFIQHGDNGYLVNTDQDKELASYMLLAINNSEMKDRVISMRNTYINKYSWNTVARKIKSVLDNGGIII